MSPRKSPKSLLWDFCLFVCHPSQKSLSNTKVHASTLSPVTSVSRSRLDGSSHTERENEKKLSQKRSSKRIPSITGLAKLPSFFHPSILQISTKLGGRSQIPRTDLKNQDCLKDDEMELHHGQYPE